MNQSITTSHRIERKASRVIDSTDEASSDENATALTRGGFNTGVPRLWHAIATRSVAVAGEKFHEIQRSGFTMKAPPLCLRYFRAPTERLGGKPSQVLIRKSVCLPFLGEWGRCANRSRPRSKRGDRLRPGHMDSRIGLFDCFSFRSDSEKEGFE